MFRHSWLILAILGLVLTSSAVYLLVVSFDPSHVESASISRNGIPLEDHDEKVTGMRALAGIFGGSGFIVLLFSWLTRSARDGYPDRRPLAVVLAALSLVFGGAALHLGMHLDDPTIEVWTDAAPVRDPDSRRWTMIGTCVALAVATLITVSATVGVLRSPRASRPSLEGKLQGHARQVPS